MFQQNRNKIHYITPSVPVLLFMVSIDEFIAQRLYFHNVMVFSLKWF